jgi:hypothetical protein
MTDETRNGWVLAGFGALGIYLLWTSKVEERPSLIEGEAAENLQKVLMGNISTDRVMSDDLLRIQHKLNRHAGSFDPIALQRGIEHELETSHNPLVAQKVAMDRLSQSPDYYDALADEALLPTDEVG